MRTKKCYSILQSLSFWARRNVRPVSSKNARYQGLFPMKMPITDLKTMIWWTYCLLLLQFIQRFSIIEIQPLVELTLDFYSTQQFMMVLDLMQKNSIMNIDFTGEEWIIKMNFWVCVLFAISYKYFKVFSVCVIKIK